MQQEIRRLMKTVNIKVIHGNLCSTLKKCCVIQPTVVPIKVKVLKYIKIYNIYFEEYLNYSI